MLLVGGLVGWLFHPVLWVVAGPFRWSALLYMTAAQESGFNPDAIGDQGNPNGDSVGIVQFNTGRWPDLTGDRPLTDRNSPLLSGYYSARYVAQALYTSWAWWAMALPFCGAPTMRWMWTHGISASAAESAKDEACAAFRAEGHSMGAFLLARSVTLLPAAVATLGLVLFVRKLAARLRRRRS
jgi:hypothetical protein